MRESAGEGKKRCGEKCGEGETRCGDVRRNVGGSR